MYFKSEKDTVLSHNNCITIMHYMINKLLNFKNNNNERYLSTSIYDDNNEDKDDDDKSNVTSYYELICKGL